MTPTELRERQMQNTFWSMQSQNPMAQYQNYLNNSQSPGFAQSQNSFSGISAGSGNNIAPYPTGHDFQNAYKPPEPTAQEQISEWEGKLNEAVSHPPSKHRDAAIQACHDVLQILDKMKESVGV